MQSLELFWPCSILAKNQGDVLARGLSYQGLEAFEARPQSAFGPGLKGLEALFIKIIASDHVTPPNFTLGPDPQLSLSLI